jgi:hypothetical protein
LKCDVDGARGRKDDSPPIKSNNKIGKEREENTEIEDLSLEPFGNPKGIGQNITEWNRHDHHGDPKKKTSAQHAEIERIREEFDVVFESEDPFVISVEKRLMKTDLHHRESRVDEEDSKEDENEDGRNKVPVPSS